jgi:hypothetical protein
MKKFVLVSIMFSLILLLVGCGTTKPQDPGTVIQNELEDAPKWVLQGHGSDQDLIYGVGSATGTRNVALARSSALGRARTEISRQLDLKVKAMLKDYQATTTGGEYFGTVANDEQHIVDVAKQVVDLNLSGTYQEDTWISQTGTMYVLVSLDVEHFKNAVNDMQSLSEDIRAAVVERAEAAFQELDDQ